MKEGKIDRTNFKYLCPHDYWLCVCVAWLRAYKQLDVFFLAKQKVLMLVSRRYSYIQMYYFETKKKHSQRQKKNAANL